MAEATQTIDYNTVKYLFNNDFPTARIFNDLLYVVANNELTNPSINISQNVIYNYYIVRPAVDKFVKETIYETLFKNDMYDGLIEMLIDFFSCLGTIVYMRRYAADVDIQPDEIISEYLKSFGFPYIDIFDATQRKEICRNVYNYLRKKGTPDVITKLLIQLGFTNYCVLEFWLNKYLDETGEEIKEIYKFKPEMISVTGKQESYWELYIKNKEYTIPEMTGADPLWQLNAADLDKGLAPEGLFTLPAKSPYYQLCVAVSDTETERLACMMIYACAKKCLYDLSIGQDNKVIYYPLYGKVTMLDLLYAYAMISEQCGNCFDLFALNSKELTYRFDKTRPFNQARKYSKFDLQLWFDMLHKNQKIKARYDKEYQSNINNENALITFEKPDDYYGLGEDSLLDHDADILSRLPVTALCWGWNGDVSKDDINKILRDIKNKFEDTFQMIEYYPSRIIYDPYTKTNRIDNCKTRFYEEDEIINEFFISPCLFGDIDDTLQSFYDYNPNFYEFFYNTINGLENNSLEKYNTCIDILYEILSLMENYIYSKCEIKFNLRQMLIKYNDFLNTCLKLDKGFAPYHAKMQDPEYIYMIQDIPYDQILIADLINNSTNETRHYETFWRAEWQAIFDGNPPDPYAPAFDWYQHMSLPDEEFGHYDPTRTIIINGIQYSPQFDFTLDEIKTFQTKIMYSGYKRKVSPHEEQLEQLAYSFDATLKLGTEFTVSNLVNISRFDAKRLLEKMDLRLFKRNEKVNLTFYQLSYSHQFDNNYERLIPRIKSDIETGEFIEFDESKKHLSNIKDDFDSPRWDDYQDIIIFKKVK